MDERIKIYTRAVKVGFRSRVMVNGEWYASVDAPSRDEAQGEAQHYAMQIEFDEWGNW